MANEESDISFMKLRHFVILFILCVAALPSCIQDISLEPEGERRIAVYCVLKEDTVQTLQLYYAKGFSQGGYDPVEADTVEIITDKKERWENGNVSYLFRNDSSYYWSARFTPNYGANCELRIVLKNKEVVSSKIIFPPELALCNFSKIISVAEGDTSILMSYGVLCVTHTGFRYTLYPYECRMWIRAHEGNWKSPISQYIGTDHPFADNYNLTSKLLTDLPSFGPGGAAHNNVCLRMISDYFPNMAMHDTWVHIVQPANFDNGYDTDDPKSPYWWKFCFVLASEYKDASTFEYAYEKWFNDKGRFEVSFVTKDYDLYLKDVAVKYGKYETDLSYMYSDSDVNSNIIGGIGIFGAVIRSTNCGDMGKHIR